MVAWIEPLGLEMWIVNVFSGSLEIFMAVAMFFIFGMASYFRMNILTMIFMFVIFLLMFSLWVDIYFLLLIGTIGGLLIGVWIKNLVGR